MKIHNLSDDNANLEDIYHDIRLHNYDVVEELLVQHPSFAAINKHGFPVIRVLTFLDERSVVKILATTLTVGQNDDVINLHREAFTSISTLKLGGSRQLVLTRTIIHMSIIRSLSKIRGLSDTYVEGVIAISDRGIHNQP